MNHSRLTYATLLVAASLWCGLIILAPMLAASASPLAEYCYRFFQPVCHQRPERSFFLFGNQLGVCVR
ncbi:MAG TPA: DUF2085 domain-containing protein, partial [Bacteroidota bacterium]|nr:DUF2085 domain-containing protein [Bacteroidota bacterium]